MAATATATIAPQTPDVTGRHTFVEFTVALTGNYGTNSSNGDTLDLTPLNAQSSQLPTWVEFGEYPPAGTAPTGYQFGYAPGTTIANGKLTIMGAQGTPAGTIVSTSTAPTINTVTDSGTPTKTLGELTGALSTNGAVTGITGVQAPTITSTFTGTAPASGSSQYPEGSAYSAALLAAVIRGRAWFPNY